MTKQQWAIISILAVAVVLVFCLLAYIVVSSTPTLTTNITLPKIALPTFPTAVPVPTATPFPTPRPRCDARDFIEKSLTITKRFDDVMKRADVTPRIALSSVVGEMQQVRRDYESIVAPTCARDAHRAYLDAMDAQIDLYLLFMAQASESQMKYQRDFIIWKINIATEKWDELFNAAR